MRRHSDDFSRSHLADVDEESEADLVMEKMSRSSKSRSPDIWKSSRYERKSANGSLSSDLYWEATGRRRSSDQGIVLTTDTDSFIIGQRVWVGGVRPGHIAYIGETHFAPGDWAGVVLDEPSGKNDGCVSGKRYFQCEAKRGIFSRLTRLTREPLLTADSTDDLYRSPSRTPASPVRTISPPSSVRNSVTPSRSGTKSGMQIGDRVIVSSGFGSRPGVLKYIGETQFAPGNWCGVQLDDPTGKNNGAVDGIRYFECPDKYGIFVPLAKVTLSPSAKKTFVRLPRSNSKESLTSIGTLGSMASTNTSRLRMGANAQRLSSSTKPITTPKNTFSLQDVLREKQNHIEQLLAEKDLDRQDADLQSVMYQKDINELKQKIVELEGRLKDEQRRNEDLQFSVDEAQFCGDELSVKRIKLLEAQSQEYKERITTLEEELAQSKTSLITTEAEGESIKVKELTEKVEELKKTLSLREEELKNVREEEKDRSNKILELQKQLIEAESNMDIKVSSLSVSENCLKEEIKMLSSQNDELCRDIETQKASMEALEVAQKVLLQEKESLKAENAKTSAMMGKIVSDGEVSSQKHAQEIRELEEKIQKSEERMQIKKTAEEDLMKENQKHVNKIADLEKELSLVSSSKDGTVAESLAKGEKIKEFEKLVESLNAQLSEANSATTSSREEVDSVQKSLSDHVKCVAELKSECEVLRKNLSEHESKLQDTVKNLEAETIQKCLKIEECEKLRATITSTTNSSAAEMLQSEEKHREEVKKLTDRLKSVEDEKEALKASLQHETENGEKQKLQIESLSSNLMGAEQQKISLQDQFNQLDLSHGDLVRKFQALEEKCAQLTTDKQSLQTELTSVRNSSLDTNSEVARLAQELESKKASLESLSESSTATKLTLEKRIQELSQLVEKFQGEIDSLATQKIHRENELNGELAKTKELLQNEMELTKKKYQDEKEKLIQEINVKLEEAEVTRNNLTACITRLEESVAGLEKDLENSRNHQKVLENELECAKKQFESLERDLTVSKARVLDLEMAKNCSDSSQEDLLNRMKEKDIALAEVRDERDTLKVEVGALRENFEQQIKEIVDVKGSLEEITKCRDAEKTRADELGEKLRDMEDEQVDLVDRSEQMTVKITDLETLNASLEASLGQLSLEADSKAKSSATESESQKAEIVKLTEERDAARKEVAETVNLTEELKSQLKVKEASLVDFQAKVAQVVTESESFQNSLREDLSRKVDACQELEKKCTNLEQSVKSAEEEKAKAEKVIQSLEEKVANLRKSSDEVDSSRAAQDVEMSELLQKLKELTEKLCRRDDKIVQFERQESHLKGEVAALHAMLQEREVQLKVVKNQLEAARSNPVAPAVNTVDDSDAGAQISFLNSIIADMQKKNTELVARVQILEAAPGDFSQNGLNLEMPVRRKPAPRLFCDICDIFDAHDTEDCPLQASDSPVPPDLVVRQPGEERVLPPPRKYCESCEVFGHEIGECDNDESF
ncbi:restin homolog isoform X3 [Phlebotomus argentipes]|uniref:restin homolog isoform X3 n=1 Tax=Phlebotomus argentipes TaxID=94469 RepID=UPI0028937240|nr:restin homolog isoform X3 [Phlebotomus argentipes]